MSTKQTSGERREQILHAALVAFSHRGYHETSMVDIADAIGVTKPVIYQHFDSKRELYLELLDASARYERTKDQLTLLDLNGNQQLIFAPMNE